MLFTSLQTSFGARVHARSPAIFPLFRAGDILKVIVRNVGFTTRSIDARIIKTTGINQGMIYLILDQVSTILISSFARKQT